MTSRTAWLIVAGVALAVFIGGWVLGVIVYLIAAWRERLGPARMFNAIWEAIRCGAAR